MPGVHSIHRLPGAVAVVARRWWQARRAVEALRVDWKEAVPDTARRPFLAGMSAAPQAAPDPGIAAEEHGDTATALEQTSHLIEATYDAPDLVHGQLEPPSAIARWNSDGSLELWLPNQASEMFQQAAAKLAGIAPEKSSSTLRHWTASSAGTSCTARPILSLKRSVWPRPSGAR